MAARAHAAERPAHSRAHARSRQLARADAPGVGRRRRHHVAQGAQGARLRRLPQDPRGDRRLQARFHRDVGRRPVRELQGRHHPAVLRARVRAARFQAVPAPARAAQHLGRAHGQGLHRIPGTTRPGAISPEGSWRTASTCPTPTSPCTRTAWATPSPTRCSTSISTARDSTYAGRARRGQLLRQLGDPLPGRQHGALGRAGSAVAVAAPLLRDGTGDRARPEGEPVAGGDHGLVELVARLPHREEPLDLSRPRIGPRAARAPARRELQRVARYAARADGGGRPAGSAQLDLPRRRHGRARTTRRTSSTGWRPGRSTRRSAWRCSGVTRACFSSPVANQSD